MARMSFRSSILSILEAWAQVCPVTVEFESSGGTSARNLVIYELWATAGPETLIKYEHLLTLWLTD